MAKSSTTGTTIMPQAFSQSAQVRSSAIINRWISSLVFGSFSTIRTTDLGTGEDRRLELMWGDRRRNSMADRDRQRRSPRVVLEGASGPVRRNCRSGPPSKAPATLPGPTRRRSVAVAPQPTGASRVGNHGETKPQKSPDVRRPYRVGLVEKQTPSCSGMHKMRSRDGRSGQHRPPGRRTGIDRV
ncbi:MAG: hypothetical protein QOD25_2803 [Alphaproteobacteria bacterium]|nr:hypothetical protein [Alphaproteobacteria bacterium]